MIEVSVSMVAPWRCVLCHEEIKPETRDDGGSSIHAIYVGPGGDLASNCAHLECWRAGNAPPSVTDVAGNTYDAAVS